MAKSIRDVLLKAEIKKKIQEAVCVGPLHELTERICIAEEKIIRVLEGEIRDYIAHEVMKYEHRCQYGLGAGTIREFFNILFRDIPAFNGEEK